MSDAFEMTKRNTVYLPEDLLVEILSRVPEPSLARFQSVSKGWNVLIKNEGRLAKKSPNLMLIDSRVYLASLDLHGLHENVVKSTTSQFSLKDPLSKSSEEVEIGNVFHCDGLLLCTTKDKRLVVWNPRSGETSWIKPRNSYKVSDTYALGKSFCNKYKILRVDQDGRSIIADPVKLEIYDFTSKSWRSIVKTTKWCIPRMWSRGTSVSGNTYWLAHSQIGPDEKLLLSFDFSKERFGLVSLPGNHLSYYLHGLSVTREDQQLCLLTTRRSLRSSAHTIDLWRATNIKRYLLCNETKIKPSWRKFLSLNTSYVYQPFSLRRWSVNFLADRENKVIVVCPGKHGNSNKFLHIVGKDKCIQVDGHDEGSKCSLLFSYVPTLAQIK